MFIAAGDETRVNSYTTDLQFSPQITALSDGGWVVTWQSNGQDGSNYGLYQQAYNADGTAQGVETRVNSYTTNYQVNPQITALSDGGWVVTWYSFGQDGSNYGVYQQAYNADGTAQGVETRVNSHTTDDQYFQQITALSDGGWVVTWNSDGQDGSGYGVYQQVYNADGTAQGVETRVNSYTTDNQASPQITALSDGGWVVTWNSIGQDGSGYGVYQQAYNADGTAQGIETRVNSYTTDDQGDPQITALSDGGWVVTWNSIGQDGSGYGVYQQAYNADGTAQGVETRVNSYTTGDQYYPQITALSDGGWAVTWTSNNQDGSGPGVYQQAYNADGTAQGVETRVNSHTTGNQETPQITALSDGGWVVTWRSIGQDGSNYGVYQQAYNAEGSAQGVETRVNSYTTDDQINPQITVLSDGGWVVTWMSIGQDGSSYGVYQRTFHLDNTAPVVANAIAEQAATEDAAFTFQVASNAFADVDAGETLTYTASLANGDPLPSWLSFDAATRTFSGTPDNGDVGVVPVRVTATDGSNASVSDEFSITVANINDAPTGAAKTLTISEDSSYTFTESDFGFADTESDDFEGITVASLSSVGNLTLDGGAVVTGQFIERDDLDQLTWTAGENVNGAGLHAFAFTVKDDGGTANSGADTSVASYAIDFDVSEVIDRFIGTKKNDTLAGTDGADRLRGRGGDDVQKGFGGDDDLRSIWGNDRFWGGTGADLFIYSTGSARDMIMDFETGIDTIDISRWTAIDDFADLQSHARNKSGDLWIVAGKDTLIINHFSKAELNVADFVV